MNEQNNNLEKQVQDLHAALDGFVADAQRRKNVSLVVMLVVIVAMGIYFSIAYKMIAQFDAETVATLAEGEVELRLAGSTREIADRLKEYAPTAIGQVESLVLQVPDAVADELIATVGQIITERAPELEETLIAHLEAGLEEAHAKLSKDGKQVPEEEFKQALDAMAEQYGKELRRVADQLHRMYADNSKEMLDYLNQLGANQNLTERQQRHRKLIVLLLSLLEKYHQESANKPDAVIKAE